MPYLCGVWRFANAYVIKILRGEISMKKVIINLIIVFLSITLLSGCNKENNTDVKESNKGSSVVSDDASKKDKDITTEKETEEELPEKVSFEGLEATPAEDFVYEITKIDYNDKKTECVKIRDYIGTRDIVVVPEEIEGYPVMIINLNGKEDALKDNIKGIKLPDNVKSVNMSYRINLITVECPQKVDWLKEFKFKECVDLTYINIPEGITQIGSINYTLSGTNIYTLEFPSTINYIAEEAFKNMKSIRIVIMPKKVETLEIDQNAFENCSNIESINFPEGCSVIGFKAFKYCNSLKSVIIPESVKKIHTQAFAKCEKLEEIIIEESDVELKLEKRCFDSESLKYIEIPERVLVDELENAFPKVKHRSDITICCKKGDSIEAYAMEKKYTVEIKE